ncbi:MAG: DUF4166 domain-containing protein [Schumannella sp.]
MASVYERVLGARFGELDPGLRAYFGEIPDGSVGRGSGVYEVAGSRHRFLVPVLAWFARREVLFPEYGRGIPFTVENRPTGDRLRARRTFAFPRAERIMTDEMAVVDGVLHDRLGRRGGLEVELALDVTDGALRMRSGRQWLHLGPLRMRLPAIVTVELSESAEATGQRVDVRMTAPVLGEVFRYAGVFRYFVTASSSGRPSEPRP